MDLAARLERAREFLRQRSQMEQPNGAPRMTWLLDVPAEAAAAYLAGHGGYADNCTAFALRPLEELAYALPADHRSREFLIAYHDLLMHNMNEAEQKRAEAWWAEQIKP